MASPISGRLGVAQRRADHLQQIIVVDRLVEKRHRPAGHGAFLVLGILAAGDDDDGDFFRLLPAGEAIP